jgi:hypothetical protein
LAFSRLFDGNLKKLTGRGEINDKNKNENENGNGNGKEGSNRE